MDIQGCTAIVTGGGSGMGAETARHLANAGANVVILDRDLTNAKQVAVELNAHALACDVANAEDVERIITQIEQELGNIRICVNCAGIATAQTIVSKEHAPMPLADFSKVINVNLLGTFNVMRVVAAAMSKLQPIGDSEERGIIINTASVAAFEGQIGQAAYSASKGGVVAMTLPAARELARYGIRVMTIAPGLIATPMLLGMPDKVKESLAATVPFPRRFGKPSEYAQLVLHIIDNPMLNGTVIRLDGALRMAPK